MRQARPWSMSYRFHLVTFCDFGTFWNWKVVLLRRTRTLDHDVWKMQYNRHATTPYLKFIFIFVQHDFILILDSEKNICLKVIHSFVVVFQLEDIIVSGYGGLVLISHLTSKLASFFEGNDVLIKICESLEDHCDSI